MFQKFILVILLLASVGLFADGTAPLYGNGTQPHPHEIRSYSNLLWLATTPGAWTIDFNLVYYIQTVDIDASESEYLRGGGMPTIGRYYAYDDIQPFVGQYDGQGYTISNLYINRPDDWCQGLFGYTGSTGIDGLSTKISNLNITEASVTGGAYTGILVGESHGLRLINCSVDGAVSAGTDAGGLIGKAHDSIIEGCYNLADVYSAEIGGGIVGEVYNTDIKDCYNRGTISGGFGSGGIVGALDPDSTIENCYSAAPIQGYSYVGGIVGDRASPDNSVEACFWDTDIISDATNGTGGGLQSHLIGLTTAEMQISSNYTDDGDTWDFEDTWDIIVTENGGYPFLRWQTIEQNNPGSGETSGTPADEEPLEVPVIPMDPVDYDGNGAVVVVPDVEVNPNEDGATITVGVRVTPGNEAVPVPENVSLTYEITISGTEQAVEIVLNFDGLPFEPTEIVRYNGTSWEIVEGVVWAYAPVFTATFEWTFDTPFRDGGEDFVMNEGEDGALPVTLTSFTAIATSENYAQIDWETQSETNLIGFNIYRNTDDTIENSIILNNNIISGINSSIEQDYSFVDEEIEFETEYYYWLESVDLDGSSCLYGSITLIINNPDQPEDAPGLVEVTGINSIFPNPFNPTTTISFSLVTDQNVTVSIYNVKGRLISTLVDGFRTKGHYDVVWNGKDKNNKDASSGVYFIQMIAGKIVISQKTILLK